MKYVAFIDILGFKNRLQDISHDKAKEVIRSFNHEIYSLWHRLGYNGDQTIKGRTFSDSLIIYTSNINEQQLIKLITFLIELYRISILRCDLSLRGGVAIGEYDDIKATEFDNLQKGIIVGNAFIDAYTLESTNAIKGSKILFKQEIKLKIENLIKNYTVRNITKDTKGNQIYELKWADIMFLVENNYSFLKAFVNMACRSKWIDHYYGTLDTFLINETKADKQDVYIKIIDQIEREYKHFDLDNFIENFMKSSCSSNLKKSFLAYIRERLSYKTHNHSKSQKS
jgi:hypothetical protein